MPADESLPTVRDQALPPLPPVTEEMRNPQRIEIAEADLPPEQGSHSTPITSESQPPAEAPYLDSDQELGSVAVEAGVNSDASTPDDFHLKKPDELYSAHRALAGKVERAQEGAEKKQSWYDSHTWLGKNLSGYVKGQKELADKAKEDLATAKEQYDQQLEVAKQYLDKAQEQANEYVAGYKKYIEIQEKLAGATGAPAVSVKSIVEFIRGSTGHDSTYNGSIDDSAAYAGLRDFFAPRMPRSTNFDGRFTKYNDPLPRVDVGLPIEEVLKQVEGDEEARLLKITDTYIPWVTHGYYTYETVRSTPQRTEKYIRLTPELVELFQSVSPNKLNFNTDLYAKEDTPHGVYTPSVAEVGSKFEIVSVKDTKEEMEVAQLPHKAVLEYEKDIGRGNGTAWQEVEIRAESEEQLRERVLTHLLENLSLPDVDIDGKRVNLKDFLHGKQDTNESVAA